MLFRSLAACNGPKEKCEGSFKSYFSMIEGQDFSGMYEMLTPKFKKKVKSVEHFSAAMLEQWNGTYGFSKKVDSITESADGICIARGSMSYTWRVRGKEAVFSKRTSTTTKTCLWKNRFCRSSVKDTKAAIRPATRLPMLTP